MLKPKQKIWFLLLIAVCTVLLASCSGDSTDTKESVDTGTNTKPLIVTDSESQSAETDHQRTDETQTVSDTEEISVFLNPDGREFADWFACYDQIGYGCIRAYWDTGSQRVLFEAIFDDEWNRYFYINGQKVFENDFLILDDIRVADDYIIVVTGGTDANSFHLYLFDFTGQLLYETYYLTDHGMIFQRVEALGADRILVYGSRMYHGPSLLMPDSETVLSGAYASSLYEDPISDVIEGGAVISDSSGEVPLGPDRASVDPDLNPDLVMSGVYALPFRDGSIGKIGHVETTQTLGDFLDETYGGTSKTDMTVTVSDAVDEYLNQLVDGAGNLFLESEVIAQNPAAFDALVALGEDALPYLTDIGKKMPAMMAGTDESIALCIRAALAQMAAYHIDQRLYDKTELSPDGSVLVSAKVGSFLGVDWGGILLTQYDRIVFTDAATGAVLWEYPCDELYMISLQFQWSPDSRYSAMSYGSERGRDTVVFDMTEKTARTFPDIREITALAGLGEELPSYYTIGVKTWREDGRPDCEVFFDYGMTTIGECSFVFDPATGELSDFVCDVYNPR